LDKIIEAVTHHGQPPGITFMRRSKALPGARPHPTKVGKKYFEELRTPEAGLNQITKIGVG